VTLPRRRFLHLAAGAVALPAVPQVATAQTYPSRAVRLIVGFPAGGPTDITARVMAQWLSERLGQQVVVDNRAGAGSNIATEGVVNAPPDGYTLLLVGATNAINVTLYDKLNFNFVRDIAPVAGIIRVPLIMEVHPSFPAGTVAEFIAYAKAHPGKINMGSGGIGTTLHVSGELFKMMTGVDMLHVPYRGAGPMLTDLLGGQVQVGFDPMPSSIGYVKAGRLRHGGNDRDALGGAAGGAKRGRRPAGQCWPCRSEAQGQTHRARRHDADRIAGRVRQLHRR
jgi:tripartite-type tricarboxylate transporter receptor subunit TctC